MFSTHGLNAEHFGKKEYDLLQFWYYTHFAKNKGVDICNGFDVLFCIAGAMAAVGIYPNEQRIFAFVFFLHGGNVFKGMRRHYTVIMICCGYQSGWIICSGTYIMQWRKCVEVFKVCCVFFAAAVICNPVPPDGKFVKT